jgi:hypothetical protein
LSPNAAKNWHQNKGAKRRVVISDMDIIGLGVRLLLFAYRAVAAPLG